MQRNGPRHPAEFLPKRSTTNAVVGYVVVCASITHTVGIVEEGGHMGCPPKDNSTRAFVRCLLARDKFGESDFSADHQVPTEAADQKARDHLAEITDSATGFEGIHRNLAVMTPHFREQLRDWATTGEGLPRIHVFRGGHWDQTCEYTQYNLGYRYMMEHWLKGFITSNQALLVDDVGAADYLYLPHCATGIFMHVSAADSLGAPPRKKGYRNPLLQGLGSTRVNGTKLRSKNLVYEGNLQSVAVRRTDDVYLMRLVQYDWSRSPAFQECGRRPNCRFLIPSIYGRHVWRRFASYFGDRAVFITHSGMSTWLSQQKSEHFLEMEPSRNATVRPGSYCKAACPAHCVRDPPSVLRADIVLPWIAWYQWTPRSAQFGSRDLLAFYSGTDNSCSRNRLLKRFRGHFDDVRAWAWSDPGAQRSRALRPFTRALVFPPEIRLRQEDWSELAFRSRLCLVPDGDSPNTGRLAEVIMHGCVPLIISDRLQPPLHEFLDWRTFAFFVREDSIKDLPRILRYLATPRGMEQVREKQKVLQQAAQILSMAGNGIGALLFVALRDRARSLRQTLGMDQFTI